MSSFLDNIELIDKLLDSRKRRWRLKSRNDIDFDDVKQIIRIHLLKKWDKWDQTQPLGPWLSRVICHQIINILRKN